MLILFIYLLFQVVGQGQFLEQDLLLVCLVYGLNDIWGGVSLPVNCFYFVDDVPYEVLHLFLIGYYEVHISVVELESNALPTEKGNGSKFWTAHWVEVLSQKPEPRICASELYPLNLVYAAAARRFRRPEIRIVILLYSRVALLFILQLGE